MVYVIAKDKTPLMPCENVVARLLLRNGKAKVKSRCPFTIQLLEEGTAYTQKCTHGIDTGSGTIGSAVVAANGSVLYMSEVQARNDIAQTMTARSKRRRNRRNRKTRYRPKRFDNRKNSIKEDRFSPTMVSKIHSHEKEISFASKILPVSRLIIETATFDPHLILNPGLADPAVRPWGYQQGRNYGFQNTRQKVLFRDKYTCQCCKGKSKDPRKHVHHVIFKSQGGSDDEENLVTVCETCHKLIHAGLITLKLKGKRKTSLLHTTQMNGIRKQLLRRYPNAIETFGYVTQENRYTASLPKAHCYDACVIAGGGEKLFFKTNAILHKKCVPDGDFQRTKGVRSEQRLPKGKISGFLKFDKVRYFGKEYFVKGRMSSGFAILMNIFGETESFSAMPKGYKTPKLENCRRVGARKTWIMCDVPIVSAC